MSIANELITRGWWQGPEEGPHGEVCLKRAAVHAYPEAASLTKSSSRPAPWVYAALFDAVGSAPGMWNDRPGRTFDEVLRVAKEADELLEAP